MAKKKKKKPQIQEKPVIKQMDQNTKNFIKASCVEALVSLIIFIIGYNLSGKIQNLYFMVATVVSIIGFAFVSKKFFNKFFEGAGVAIASMCILITVLNVYNVLDVQFNWARDKAFNEAAHKIEKFDKLYSNDVTSLYFDKDNLKLYSVTNTGTSKYFYETNLSNADESEYSTLFGEGFLVKSQDLDVQTLAIHPATMSTLTGYEHLLEFQYKGTLYLVPTFIMGDVEWQDNKLTDFIELQFGNNAAQNYSVYKLEDSFLVNNIASAFVTPYTNVPYDKEALFQTRYIEFMKSFNENYEMEENLTFGVSKTLEINKGDISRITFYYEIYGGEEVGGLLMEIAYTNGTADVCYIKEMYAENLVSVNVKGG